jgi:hypothetical protein
MGKKHDQSGRYSGTCEKVEVAMGWTCSEKDGWQMDARGCDRKQGRPSGRWADELRRMGGVKWMQIAQDRQKWKSIGEAFIQQWMVYGRK